MHAWYQLYPLIGVNSVPGSVHSIFTYDSAGSREREFISEIRQSLNGDLAGVHVTGGGNESGTGDGGASEESALVQG
eukprot:COSAG01_NODE_204_length_22090_cov_64.189441_2_plen_77_part_00